jgi:hypothetical protein
MKAILDYSSARTVCRCCDLPVEEDDPIASFSYRIAYQHDRTITLCIPCAEAIGKLARQSE